MITAAPAIAADPGILERNLRAIARRSPASAAAIAAAPPHPGIEFVSTDESDALSALLDGRPLASRRRPRQEGARLAETFDPSEAGLGVVLGFGVGHHVEAIARRMGREGVVVVFEPDVSLLRAVFERIDLTTWLDEANVVLVTGADDSATLSTALTGAEAALSLGVKFIDHPPSRQRLAEDAARFCEAVGGVVSAVRTTVVTTLVQSEATLRNLFANAARYARPDAGIGPLQGACVGCPAIIVSAGPSLRRNIELLRTPGLRERCLIISAQTTLRPLLAIGVRPHFVVALDYHEISRRFYENLTSSDVEGVTLVVEPKVNPGVVRAFPGAIRCVGDATLERLLGERLAPNHAPLPQGATVAHLAYSFARFLGADPAILIGQDLGFTDGQYYAQGAAIHDTWACELGPFNTLEQMEWQRIARNKRTLRKTTDVLGRAIYTDEQMHAYRAQFEREFLADEARALRTIDATEGGVAKRHTEAMALREAIDAFAPDSAPPIDLPNDAPAPLDASRVERLDKRLRSVRADVGRIAYASRQALSLMERMLDRQDDQTTLNRLIGDAEKVGREIMSLEPAFPLVQRLNQTGAFRRMRADRSIRIDEGLVPLDRQRRQIERDRDNARWTAEAADMLGAMLDDAVRTLHDDQPSSSKGSSRPARSRRASAPTAGARRTRTLAALIPLSAEQIEAQRRAAVGTDAAGAAPLVRTLERLASCAPIRRVLVATPAPAAAEALLAGAPDALRVEIVPIDSHPLGARRRPIESARAFAPTSWRGGIASLTHFDELIDPAIAANALRDRSIDSALLIGPDWTALDAPLCDRIIERHLEDPDEIRLAFSQAPPGVAGVCVGADLLAELAAPENAEQALCTFGHLLGYLPVKPQADPIAHRSCVQIDPALRDLGVRLASTHAAAGRCAALLETGADASRGAADPDAPTPARRLRDCLRTDASLLRDLHPAPAHLLVECAPPTPAGGERDAWFALDATPDRPPLDPALLERILADLGDHAPRTTLTLLGPGAGAGEPLDHPDWRRLLDIARHANLAGLHVRTDLVVAPEAAVRLLEAPADIVSVDLYAHSAAAYERIAGRDAFRQALENVDALLRARTFASGLPRTWIVPRLTRCDAVYEEIEVFHDKWILLAGASVIDQLPRALPDQRIEPLGKPGLTRRRDALTRLRICSNGLVLADERDLRADSPVADLNEAPLADAWSTLLDRRLAALLDGDVDHPDLRTGW